MPQNSEWLSPPPEAFGILWHGEAHRKLSDFSGKSSDVQGIAPDWLPQPACSRGMDLPQELSGAVEWMKRTDLARGFGFVVPPDEGGREAFVHSTVLFRSGMTDL